MDKLSIKEIFEKFNNELLKTNNIESALINFIENELKAFDGEIDYSEYKELVFEQFKISQSIHYLSSKKEIETTLKNTLVQYNYEFLNEQIKVFNELIKYDKACIIDGNKVFYRLNILLNKILEHLSALEKWKDLDDSDNFIERGISRTKHPKIIDAITPRIKTIKDYSNLNPTSSSKILLNIYEQFEMNPLEINAIYGTIHKFKEEQFLLEDKEGLKTLFNQKTYLNSSKILEDTHIFDSCKITSYLFYKENTLIDLSLQLKEHIPYTTLANYINILMDSFFDYEFTSNLTKKHLKKEVQLKTYFYDLEIFEYRTKKNYQEHPIFDDAKFG